MLNRRNFLKTTAAFTTAASGLLASDKIILAADDPQTSGPKQVPDTLELSHHGKLAINGMLGSLNPEKDYECAFLNILDVHPAYMLHWSTMVSGVMPKYMESLPLLRLMSGSDQDLDIEKGYMDAMVRNASQDGLVYDRALESRPWNVGVFYGKADWNEDYANMAGNGRFITGLLFMFQKTGDKVWMERAKKTAERMLELAISEGDMAWYPNPGVGNDFSYPRVTGWTTRNAPERANEGFEGASMFYLFQPLRGWSRYYKATGDERFLDLSRKFFNCGAQEKFWGGATDMSPTAGAERGHFKLHFHASMAAIRGVLDYALVSDDYRAKEFAHNAYCFGRQMGLPRLGLFTTHHEGTEGCSVADMVGMAVTLTDGGVGDYWDDVEMYARNGLIEVQATDLEELKRVSLEGKERPPQSNWGGHFDMRFGANNKGVLPGQEIHERALERTIGAFGHLVGARYQTPMMMHCCTGNCCQGLYYAWEGIVRHEADEASVNMWLNRRSPWIDVWSWLPYQGKIMIQNKGMKRISVRKPGWAGFAKMRCQINGKDITPQWRANRIVLDGLKGNEQIVIETPCPVETAQYTVVNISDPMNSKERYAIDFKGHTAIKVGRIVPGDEPQEAGWYGKGERNWYRIFRRDHLKGETAPMKAADKYVHPQKLVRWTVV